MNLRSLSLLAMSCTLAAQGIEIYSNGPIITDPTGGFGGNPVSLVQDYLPPVGLYDWVLGFGAQVAASNSLADDFAVNGSWIIDGIEVFGFAWVAGGSLAPSCTDVRLEIYNGPPYLGGVPIAGSPGLANNLFTTPGYVVVNTLTNIRRALQSDPLSTDYVVQSVRVNLATPLTLTSGVYWLRFQYAGINQCPPVTTPFQGYTGYALAWYAGWQGPGWYQLVDVSSVQGKGVPFKLYGTPTTLPGAITNLGGGCYSATLNVAGQPSVGGYLRAALGNLHPQIIPVIIVGYTNPNVPLSVCSCTSHASFDIMKVGNVFEFRAPMNAAFAGFEFFLQGAMVDLVPGLAPCNLGIQFGLTDGYSWRAY